MRLVGEFLNVLAKLFDAKSGRDQNHRSEQEHTCDEELSPKGLGPDFQHEKYGRTPCRDLAWLSAHHGVGDTCLCKSRRTKDATVAMAAGTSQRIGVIATVCQAVIEAEFLPSADD